MVRREEIHAYVRAYNWDDGAETILRTISSPTVDRATALMAYWLMEGPWHSYMASKYGQHPYARDLSELQERLLGDYYGEAQLQYSPETDLRLSRVQVRELRQAGLPDALLIA
jgi:hypothetical protein